MKGPWGLLLLTLLAAPASAGALYRCVGSDGVPSYGNRKEAGARCEVVGNYTPVGRKSYRIGAPRAGFWREILNSNSEYYGGTGEGNGGGLMAEDVPWDGYSQSLDLVLPSMSTTVFKWRKQG